MDSNIRKCFLDRSVQEACPNNCKQIYGGNTLLGRGETNCLAKDKLVAFLENKVTFNVGISAFYQANYKILEEFLSESQQNQELVSYFLYISEPQVVKEIIESFSAKTLANLFRTDYYTFLAIRESMHKEKREKNIFKVKSYRYWAYLNFQKVCNVIVYLVRESNEPELACQFLVILPSVIVSNIRDYTGFSPEEEKTLYRALGDAIYELPIQSPKIYDHMLALFADDMEIFIVLSTMEILIRRQEQILDLSEKLIDYTGKNRIDLNIQYIYSELNGLELGSANEILNQLQERQMLSASQKDLVLSFLEKGNLDILKALKIDIIR
ncbi:hypothetical protein LPTSP3_g33980 [Leptospira kobayashii]|uniref:Uncharacterized protein n=1 Tax=Leptospira kobayashii TaxID=1917830 RepID=A0ABM7UMZ4_9LEPT|nr:hypothetical protein LPTSP3_g33980 [Leptospira kobayashii]